MTSSALYLPKSAAPRLHSAIVRQAPVIVTVLVLIAIWYVAAVLMNVALVRDAFSSGLDCRHRTRSWRLSPTTSSVTR
jgi:hypothetical protein